MLTERLQKRIDDLLDEVDEAFGRRDWNVVDERCDLVLLIDPDNPDARTYKSVDRQEIGIPNITHAPEVTRPRKNSGPGILETGSSRLFGVLYTDRSRMGRRDFWLWMAGLWIFWFVFEAQFDFPLWTVPMGGLGIVGWSVVVLFFVVFIPAVFNKCVRRLHDLDRSGNWLFVLFVPLLNLWLLMGMFFVGYRGENQYGPAPGATQSNDGQATH